MARLTPASVLQVIALLELVRRNHGRGIPMPKAYQDAVRNVSRRHSVTYQTIGDFRRRLGFSDVNQYVAQIERWLSGDPQPLMRTLMARSDDAAHFQIKQYFAGEPVSIPLEGWTGSDAATEHRPTRRGNGTHAPEELYLPISAETKRRLQLAHLAKLGPTLEATAVHLLERGFDVEREAIKAALNEL